MSFVPKTLYHPSASTGTPAKVEMDQRGRPVGIIEQGVPGRLPPVSVATQKEEDYYRAKGYLSLGEAVKVNGYADWPKIMVHPEHVDAFPERREMRLKEDGKTPDFYTVPGAPEKFPNVFVHNEDEQAEWEVKGWALPGKADPQVAVDARVARIEGYEPQTYPRRVGDVVQLDPSRPRGGPQEYPKFVSGKIVNSYAEEMAILDAEDGGEMTDGKIERLIAERRGASERGDDGAVERIEKTLAEAGITLKDKPHGTVWSRGLPPIGSNAALPADVARYEPHGIDHAAKMREEMFAQAAASGVHIDKRWSNERIREALRSAAA